MALYPETPNPVDPISTEQEWKTLISPRGGGKEQRRSKWSFAKYNIGLTYDLITPRSQMQILWDFYSARKGAAEAFYFYFRYLGSHKNLYIAYGDGVLSTFDIPGKSTSSHILYFDGAAQGSGWTKVTGGGAEDSDRVTFDSIPPLGTLITCDFTGYLRSRNRFEQDTMAEERFYLVCFSTGLRLKGLTFEI